MKLKLLTIIPLLLVIGLCLMPISGNNAGATPPNILFLTGNYTTGTVISVNATNGTSGVSVSGVPITSAGTLTISLSPNLQLWNNLAPGSVSCGNTSIPSIANGGTVTCVPINFPAGSGTVTNVGAVNGTPGLSVSGSPITSAGTLAISLSNNLVFWNNLAPGSVSCNNTSIPSIANNGTVTCVAINLPAVFPEAEMYMAAGQNFTNGVDPILIQFNAATNDTAGGANTSTYRYVGQVPGFYWASIALQLSGVTTGLYSVFLYKNGSQYKQVGFSEYASLYSGATFFTPPMLVYLNGTTDYISAYLLCVQGAGGTVVSGATNSWLDIQFTGNPGK